jgi:hypothetical protein
MPVKLSTERVTMDGRISLYIPCISYTSYMYIQPLAVFSTLIQSQPLSLHGRSDSSKKTASSCNKRADGSIVAAQLAVATATIGCGRAETGVSPALIGEQLSQVEAPAYLALRLACGTRSRSASAQ